MQTFVPENAKLNPMNVNILFFANLREKAGREQKMSLDAPLTLRELAARLEQTHPGLSLSGTLCAINEQYADPDTTIKAGDTVAFFPPVSGG